ncbi:MAG: histidine phosphatase family protein [Geminicoccaceae bacterium]
MPARLYALRHAPSQTPAGVRIGQTDVPLKYCDDSIFLACLQTLPRGAALITSPLRRARASADRLIAAGLAPRSRREEAALSEQHFGAWEAQAYDDLAARYGRTYWAFWDDPVHHRPPGGESFADLAERSRNALIKMDFSTTADTIVVSHAGVLRAWLALACDRPLAQALSWPVAHMTPFVFTPGPGGRLTLDAAHGCRPPTALP